MMLRFSALLLAIAVAGCSAAPSTPTPDAVEAEARAFLAGYSMVRTYREEWRGPEAFEWQDLPYDAPLEATARERTERAAAAPRVPDTIRLAPATPPQPVFQPAPCPFDTDKIDVDGLRCGYLPVPENREVTGGRMIRLAVAIAEPADATDDPVVLLPGGPGGGPLPMFISRVRGWIPSDRTLVVFDPRGTGYSGPIMCPELNRTENAIAALDLSLEEARLLYRGAHLACRDALLGQGIDLGSYNSTTVALDTRDLREALGYERWNILAGSYGVPFARATMRVDPHGIRSAVLAIGNPPDLADLLTRSVPFVARALNRVFRECAADPSCREVFPDLEEEFHRVHASLRDEPITVSVDPDLFHPASFTVNAQDFSRIVVGFLSSESRVTHVPAIIRAFGRRDPDVVRQVVERMFGGPASRWSFGMANSVMCYDAHTPRSLAEWRKVAAPYPPALREETMWLQPCEDGWHGAQASEQERGPYLMHTPSLVITGEFDPTSHPAVGEEQLRWLPNGYHIVIPGMGHMPGRRSEPCWGSLIEQFVEDPTRPPDDTCASDLAEVRIGTELPPWITLSEEDVP